MERDREPTRLVLLLGRAIAKTWPGAATKLFNTYRPEKHYMRGPGPASLGMIGDRLREKNQDIVQAPLPDHLQALLQSMRDQDKGRLSPAGVQKRRSNGRGAKKSPR
jgi:hypothetical protein